LGGTGAYLRALTRLLVRDRAFDAIWCGHLHLVPPALAAKAVSGAPVVLHIHGVDAWTPSHRRLVNWMVPLVDHFISVAEITKERFTAWSGIPPERGHVVPNTIDFSGLSPGPKCPNLLAQYGLDGPVLMTMGRLVGRERAKGFDQVFEVLPALLDTHPALTYLIAGKGPDRDRLESKAEQLGIRDHVVFAGYVPESEKADHFRLADAYVMPSRGEGFGLVVLEALACGIPVIGSTADGTAEALQHGRFGTVVDPTDHDALHDAIQKVLQDPPSVDPEAVRAHFGPAAYQHRVHAALDAMFAGTRARETSVS
jgi:glycosyltransferase involved in cell wall biosynthesis